MPESSKFHSTKPRGWLLTFAVAGFAFLAATLVPVQTTVAQGVPAVDIQAATDGISVDFFATTPRNVLTFSVRVVGPNNFVFEQRIEGASLQWIPPDNLADGLYGWEAWVVTADVGAQMRDPSPALKGRPADHWFDNEVKQTHIASGDFKVESGLLESVTDSRDEPDGKPLTRRIARAVLDFLMPSAQAQFGDFDDFVSIRCTSGCGQSRLNLNATDSVTVGVNSWRVWNNVGDSHNFQIVQGSNTPRLTIRQGGNVGIGTVNPLSPVHIDRLGGFQIRMVGSGADYRMDAFGTSLRIGDSTNTNQFRIFGAEAPFNSLVLRGNGIGMGTEAVAAALHIQRADNTAQVRVQDTGASDPGPGQTMFNLINNGPTKFRMEDTSQADVRWEFRTSGIQGDNERFQMNKLGSGVVEMQVFAGGDVSIAGSLFQASSRTVKEGIVDLNPEEVLTRLDALPVHEWSYKRSPQERHLGPMAEDFHAAFGLGGSDKHIAPGDLAGVALAAAKGLAERSARLEAENTELRDRLDRENAELRDRLEQLEAMLQSSM